MFLKVFVILSFGEDLKRNQLSQYSSQNVVRRVIAPLVIEVNLKLIQFYSSGVKAPTLRIIPMTPLLHLHGHCR